LPSGYHFGLSASTTSAAKGLDDHDIFSFEVYELDPPPKEQRKDQKDGAGGKEFEIDEKMVQVLQGLTE
jgi:hypothetical protein